ncbi:MAG: TPM domain-containing protein [Dokdonella sp.]|uniref:TPM domain-containing protein n=1 Tax=Dokdonella sp. TaxID=2291710 RepID=UPI00326365A7
MHLHTAAVASAWPVAEHVHDPAHLLDRMHMAEVQAIGSQLRQYQEETGICIEVQVAATAALQAFADTQCADASRRIVLAIAPESAAAAIDVGEQLRDRVDEGLKLALLEKRVLPHLRADDAVGAVIAGASELHYALAHGAAEIMAAAPDRVSWFDAHRDRLFVGFLAVLVVLLCLAAIVLLAEWLGWLPRKRRGFWRVLDWLLWIPSVISIRLTPGSSSGGSSGQSSDRYRGGGGGSAGGGASGDW